MSDDWTRVDAPRGDPTREWEVFVRESSEAPLRHAGSVSAPSAAVARERAHDLFGWSVAALWICPADEVDRYVAPELALDGDAAGPGELERKDAATTDP